MNRLIDPAERVIEILAIKLFEHAGLAKRPLGDIPFTVPVETWWTITSDQRETYRRIARGEVPLP